MGRALLLLVFALLLVGFAPPRDPRVEAVVLPDLGGESIEAAAHRRLQRADGVVLVVAIREQKMRIETGPRSRAMLSDADARRILDDRMRPLLREGRTDEAVEVGIGAIEDALRVPAPQTTRTTLSPAAWIGCGLGISGLLLLFASAANAGARKRRSTRSSDVVHVPYVDTSGSSGFSGGGGASSSW